MECEYKRFVPLFNIYESLQDREKSVLEKIPIHRISIPKDQSTASPITPSITEDYETLLSDDWSMINQSEYYFSITGRHRNFIEIHKLHLEIDSLEVACLKQEEDLVQLEKQLRKMIGENQCLAAIHRRLLDENDVLFQVKTFYRGLIIKDCLVDEFGRTQMEIMAKENDADEIEKKADEINKAIEAGRNCLTDGVIKNEGKIPIIKVKNKSVNEEKRKDSTDEKKVLDNENSLGRNNNHDHKKLKGIEEQITNNKMVLRVDVTKEGIKVEKYDKNIKANESSDKERERVDKETLQKKVEEQITDEKNCETIEKQEECILFNIKDVIEVEKVDQDKINGKNIRQNFHSETKETKLPEEDEENETKLEKGELDELKSISEEENDIRNVVDNYILSGIKTVDGAPTATKENIVIETKTIETTVETTEEANEYLDTEVSDIISPKKNNEKYVVKYCNGIIENTSELCIEVRKRRHLAPHNQHIVDALYEERERQLVRYINNEEEMFRMKKYFISIDSKNNQLISENARLRKQRTRLFNLRSYYKSLLVT